MMPVTPRVGIGSARSTRSSASKTASASSLRLVVVVHQVEAEVVGELRVDAVAGEAAAEAVAAVALHGHRADGDLAGHPRAGLVADAHEARSRRGS